MGTFNMAFAVEKPGFMLTQCLGGKKLFSKYSDGNSVLVRRYVRAGQRQIPLSFFGVGLAGILPKIICMVLLGIDALIVLSAAKDTILTL